MLQRPEAPTSGRIALWDNARFILILLVVFGHAIESIRGTQAVDIVYAMVYSFHIPAFMLVSGWFARSDRLDARALIGTARLVATWLIAEFAWVGIRALGGDMPVPGRWLVVPSWTLWFLVSLFCMRLLLPYFALLKWPVLVTVVIALAAGLSGEITLDFSASRTLSLLPFFVLGWWLRSRGVGDAAWFVAPSRRVRAIAAGVGVLAMGAVLLMTLTPSWTKQLLFWRRDYDSMGFDDPIGALLRLVMIVLAGLLTGALLMLVPRGRNVLSVLGRNTLPIYLLHPVALYVLRQMDVDDAISDIPLSLVIMFALAVVLTVAFGNPLVARLMRPITEPDAIFRAVAKAPVRTPAAAETGRR